MRTSKFLLPFGLAIVAGTLLRGSPGHADAPLGQYTLTSDTVYDTKTQLTWQRAASPNVMAWGDAKYYCLALNLNGMGWRLPSVNELDTIVDETRAPTIDPVAFPIALGEGFWSSSPVAGYAGFAWLVDFNNGASYSNDVDSPYRARCVR